MKCRVRGGSSVFALISFELRRTPRFALVLRAAAPRVAREGEAWWACLDSNQEPDRYERPALTIELQAPPQAVAFATATVPPPLTMWLAIRQCRPGNCSRATGVAGRVDRAARELCSLDNLVVSLIARDLGLTSVPVFAIVENFTQCLDAMRSRQLR